MHNIILNNHQFELLQESIKEKLAAERGEVNTNPTEGQCKAGNYKMGHIWINGFEISIENPKGSYRKGKDKNGKEWKTLMHNDYGYFVKTKGKDGDAIDVFLGPYLDDKEIKIYPIDQFINGEFDETKVMMGFRDKESAKSAYLSNYEKDWKGFKYITEVDLETFKKWLYDGYRQRKPFAKYVTLTENIMNKAKKNNQPKDEFAAIRKANREEEIKQHGRATALRATKEANPKAYTRKEKHKQDLKNCDESCGRKIYMTEEQFKNFCRNLLREKRKEEYVKNILKESRWYDEKYDEDYTPSPNGGNFEVWMEDSEQPITGNYTFHETKEYRTYYDYSPSERIIDSIDFDSDVPEELREKIEWEIQSRINDGEDGNLYIEL